MNIETVPPIRKLRRILKIRTRIRNVGRKLRPRTRVKIALATLRNRRKDGAILTLPGNFNYGNIIQRYALKTFLSKNNLDFELIKMNHPMDDSDKSIYGDMINFVNANNLVGCEFDYLESRGYRNYIVGSDQVWRNWYDGDDWSKLGPYFLSFLDNDKANKISYAASFGVDNLTDAGINDDKKILIRPLINKFDSISVREKSGVKLVHELSGNKKQVKLTVDPAMLLDKQDYSNIIDNSKYKNESMPRLFYYILDKTDDKNKIIKDISIKYKDDCFMIHPNSNTKYEPVEKWLKAFRDSDFVLTDSFHGTVLSIINHTNFVVFVNQYRGLSRIENLLDSCGIKRNRLIVAGEYNIDDISKLGKIDWAEVDRKLKHLRNDSEDWLLGNIKVSGLRNLIGRTIIGDRQ